MYVHFIYLFDRSALFLFIAYLANKTNKTCLAYKPLYLFCLWHPRLPIHVQIIDSYQPVYPQFCRSYG